MCETFFYRKIRAIMRANHGPEDPFSAQKQSLLDHLRSPYELHVLALLKSNAPVSRAISQSLLGNKGDLSLHSVSASLDTVASANCLTILSDQRAPALQLLHSTARVAIILDNCGVELISDLMLAAMLLQSQSCASVHLLCKSRPVWVSDVLENDIHQHLAWAESQAFADHETAAASAQFLGCIRAGLLAHRISIEPHEFLSGPEAFDDMPSDMVRLFRGCSLVICKGEHVLLVVICAAHHWPRLTCATGDANYRRLLGDRHVPFDTPFAHLTDYFPAPLLALRTCKAGLICGVAADACAGAEPDWLVSGRNAVIQFKP